MTLSRTLAAATVPVSVKLAEGATSRNFTVKTVAVDVRQTGTVRATISATANDRTKSKTLTVIPAAAVSPKTLNIGTVSLGTTSAPLVATLTNIGAIAVTIDSIAVTGTYASWFPMTENCPSSLAGGALCTISVRLRPLAAATRSAKVTITSGATATPLSVSVKGTSAQ